MEKKTSETSFKVALYMKPFYPSDIRLESVDDNTLTIRAKHEDHVDQHGFVQRELIREYKLPEGISTSKLKSEFKRNGIMIIQAVEDVQNLAVDSSETKDERKCEISEEIIKDQSPNTILGVELCERKKDADKNLELVSLEMVRQALEEVEVMKESTFGHSLQPSSAGVMPNLQTSSTDAVKGVEGTQIVPLHTSEGMDINEAAYTTRSLQINSTEMTKAEELSGTVRSPQSSSNEMEGVDSIRSPMIVSSEEMETAESTKSPLTVEMKEVTESAGSTESPLDRMEVAEATRSPKESSAEIVEDMETVHGPQPSPMDDTEAARRARTSSAECMETSGSEEGMETSSEFL